MIKPLMSRLAEISEANPKNDSTEGILGYQTRIREQAKKELLELARNRYLKSSDKIEALCQIIEGKL